MTSSLEDRTAAWIFERKKVGRRINREAREKSAVVRLKAQIIWEEYNCLAFRWSLDGFPRHWSQFYICLLDISWIDCRGETAEHLPNCFFFFFFSSGNATTLIKDMVQLWLETWNFWNMELVKFQTSNKKYDFCQTHRLKRDFFLMEGLMRWYAVQGWGDGQAASWCPLGSRKTRGGQLLPVKSAVGQIWNLISTILQSYSSLELILLYRFIFICWWLPGSEPENGSV